MLVISECMLCDFGDLGLFFFVFVTLVMSAWFFFDYDFRAFCVFAMFVIRGWCFLLMLPISNWFGL